MMISPVDMAWHGFQEPNWLNYRYSYMFCFIMIVLAAKAFTRIRDIGAKPIVIVTAFWGIFYIAMQKFSSIVANIAEDLGLETFDETIDSMLISLDNMSGATAIWTTIACIVIYCVALIYCTQAKRGSQKHERISMIIVCVMCLELFLNGVACTQALDRDVVISTHNSYHGFMDGFRSTVNYIKAEDGSFYRMEKVDIRTVNDPMTLGYRGLSNSTSTLNADTVLFLSRLGLSSSSHWSEYRGSTPVTDALLGVKYVMLTTSDTSEKVSIPNSPIYSVFYSEEIVDPDVIENFFGDQTEVADEDKVTEMTTTAYLNKYALPIAFVVDDDILKLSFDKPEDLQYFYDDNNNFLYSNYDNNPDVTPLFSPFTRMNAMINAMFGVKTGNDVFVGLESTIRMSNSKIETRVDGHTHFKYSSDGTADSAGIEFTFKAPAARADGSLVPIYAYFPSEYPRQATVYVNDEEFSTFYAHDSSCILDLGEFNPGTDVKIELRFDSETGYEFYLKDDEMYFYYVDEAAYASVFESLAASSFNITEYTERSFEGTVNISGNRNTVFTTIPYDEGWQVKVDGKPVEIKESLNALIAFEVDGTGEHTVTMEYMPSSFVTGLTLTIVGSLILIALIVLSKLILVGKVTVKDGVLASVASVMLPLPDETEVTTSPLTEDDDDDEEALAEEPDPVESATEEKPAASQKSANGKKKSGKR